MSSKSNEESAAATGGIDISNRPVRLAGGGDLRQIALFAYLWKRNQDLANNGSNLFESSEGNVGWAGVTNILVSAVQRNREFYTDPCQCDECFGFTAKHSNRRPNPSQSTGAKGSGPAFSHSATFSNVTSDRRQLLTKGGEGLADLTNKVVDELKISKSLGLTDKDVDETLRTSTVALLLPTAQRRYQGFAGAKKRTPSRTHAQGESSLFVTGFLTHNSPKNLLSITNAVSTVVSPNQVTCVAKNVSWQQQLCEQGDRLLLKQGVTSDTESLSVDSYPLYQEVSTRLVESGVAEAMEFVLKNLTSEIRGGGSRLLVRGYDCVLATPQPPPSVNSVLNPENRTSLTSEQIEILIANERRAQSKFIARLSDLKRLSLSGILERSDMAHTHFEEATIEIHQLFQDLQDASRELLAVGAIDGIGLLLHPLANAYRPQSISFWSSALPTPTIAKEATALTRHLALQSLPSMCFALPHNNKYSLHSLGSKRLTEIVLGRCTITSELCLTIALCCPTLRVLSLSHAILTHEVNLGLLTFMLSSLPQLDTLIISAQPSLFYSIGVSEREFLRENLFNFGTAIAASKTLTHIAMDSCGLSDAHFLTLFDAAVKNTIILDSGTHESSFQMGFIALEHMCLSNNNISPFGLRKVTELIKDASTSLHTTESGGDNKFCSLHSIDLSYNNLSALDGAQLAQFLEITLQSRNRPEGGMSGGIGLSIRGCQIKGEEFAKLLRTIRRASQTTSDPTEALKFSHLAVNSNIYGADLKLLPECFLITGPPTPSLPPKTFVLSSLDLSFVNLSDPQHSFYTQVLSQVLLSLANLNLSHCQINDKGCDKICAAFQKAILSKKTENATNSLLSSEASSKAQQTPSAQDQWVLQQQLKRKQKEGTKASKESKKTKGKQNANAVTDEIESQTASSTVGTGDNFEAGPESQNFLDCLPLRRFKLSGNDILPEGGRYIVRSVRAANCPFLEELSLANIDGAAAATSTNQNNEANHPQGSWRSYAFKVDTSSQMQSPWATILRSLITQVNHSHFVLLDLSGNMSMVSHLPFVEELIRLATSLRAKNWESSANKVVESSEAQTSESATVAVRLAGRPPVLNIVFRNIDRHWESQFAHSGQLSFLFAQGIFS